MLSLNELFHTLKLYLAMVFIQFEYVGNYIASNHGLNRKKLIFIVYKIYIYQIFIEKI